MSTLKATNIKNESSASNNIVLDSGGGVVVNNGVTLGTGTTISSPASDTFIVSTNGSERLRVDSSGRLAVGTTTPGNALVVKEAADATDSAYIEIVSGNAANAGILFSDTDAATRAGVLYSHSDEALRFMRAGFSEAARIDSSGRLGVGTTSPQSKASFLTTSVPASNPTWSDSWVSVGPNVGSSTGAALGLGYDGSGDEGYLVSLAPGVAFKPLNIQANVIKFQAGSSGEDVRIDSSGNVGIGATSPSTRLDIRAASNTNLIRLTDTNAAYGSSYFRQHYGSFVDRGLKIFNDAGTLALYYRTDGRLFCPENVSITGALSKGSGSFKIDHPLKPDTHYLVHSFIEGPQADLIYRGKVSLLNGHATVNIDEAGRMTQGTFEALSCNVQCFTNNESGWTCVRGSVSGNILTIEAQDQTCTDEISWMVIGERCDQHMINTDWTDENGRVITEPLKEVSTLEAS